MASPTPETVAAEDSASFAADGVDLSLIRWFLTLTPTAAQDMVDTVWALRNGEEEKEEDTSSGGPVTSQKPQKKRTPGTAKGLIEIVEDFHEPLEDFRDYR